MNIELMVFFVILLKFLRKRPSAFLDSLDTFQIADRHQHQSFYLRDHHTGYFSIVAEAVIQGKPIIKIVHVGQGASLHSWCAKEWHLRNSQQLCQGISNGPLAKKPSDIRIHRQKTQLPAHI